MKRMNSSDSLGALMTIRPSSPGNNQETNGTYHRAVMDNGDCVEESSGHEFVSEKKRRLSNEQVKALEKNFDVENKLDPERKVKLARELGLQPRQVAVWFQNRRARWKTKNLERDYGALKSNYDALENDFEALQRDNESLLKEIQELKSKLASSAKQEPFADNEEGKDEEVEAIHVVSFLAATTTTEDQSGANDHLVLYDSNKDNGSSDSDSSALLNNDDDCSPALDRFCKTLEIRNDSSSSSSMEISNKDSLEDSKRAYQPQFVKIEEHDFCTTFFDDEQAPTLNWYNPDEWD